MSRVRPYRPEPRRRDAPRWGRAEWEEANLVLLSRSGSRCERCGRDLTGGHYPVSRHHRIRRRDGGDRLANLLLLCGTGTTGCHGWITGHPAAAEEGGYILPTTINGVPTDPTREPVRLANGYLYRLDDQGGRRVVA